MAETTVVNLVQSPTCDGPAADVPGPSESLDGASDERPSTSTCNHDDDDKDEDPSPLPVSSVIAPSAAAESVVVALHRIASTTIPAAAVPVAAGSSSVVVGGGGGVRGRSTSVAVPTPRRSSAIVLNVARSLRQQVAACVDVKKCRRKKIVKTLIAQKRDKYIKTFKNVQ